MRKLKILGASLWAALLAACNGAQEPCRLVELTRIPVRFVGGEPVVTARINKAKADLLFDTGSDYSVISQSAVRRLHLQNRPGYEQSAVYAAGVNGGKLLGIAQARDFHLGALHGANPVFTIGTIGPENSFSLDGILGVDVVQSYDIDLDFTGGMIVLNTKLGACPAGTTGLNGQLYAVPLIRKANDAAFYVQATINGLKLTALVDSGAATSLITVGAAERIGLAPDRAHDEVYLMLGFGAAPLPVIRHVVPLVEIGDLTLHHLPMDVARISLESGRLDMLLGEDFLRRVHVVLSHEGDTMVMQYPALPTPEPKP